MLSFPFVIGCLDNTGVYSQPGQGHSSAPISCSFRLCSVQAVSCIGAAHESYIVPMVTGNDCIRTQGSCVTHEVRHLGMSTRLITSPPPPHVPVQLLPWEHTLAMFCCNYLEELDCNSNSGVGHAFSFKFNFYIHTIYLYRCSHCLCYHSN